MRLAKNYLTAWLLVMLKDLDLYGPEIVQELKKNFAVVSDQGTVYRVLRQLEREGYISSRWDSPEEAPSRRIYSLTESGSEALKVWSVALDRYRTSLDAFFSVCSTTWNGERSTPHEE